MLPCWDRYIPWAHTSSLTPRWHLNRFSHLQIHHETHNIRSNRSQSSIYAMHVMRPKSSLAAVKACQNEHSRGKCIWGDDATCWLREATTGAVRYCCCVAHWAVSSSANWCSVMSLSAAAWLSVSSAAMLKASVVSPASAQINTLQHFQCYIQYMYVYSKHYTLSYDQLWAASLIGRNAATWPSSLSNAEHVGGRPCDIANITWTRDHASLHVILTDHH